MRTLFKFCQYSIAVVLPDLCLLVLPQGDLLGGRAFFFFLFFSSYINIFYYFFSCISYTLTPRCSSPTALFSCCKTSPLTLSQMLFLLLSCPSTHVCIIFPINMSARRSALPCTSRKNATLWNITGTLQMPFISGSAF